MSGFRGLTFEKSLKAFSPYQNNSRQLNVELVYKIALENLNIVESCCSTNSKFCCVDVWQGDLYKFAIALMREMKNDI